MTTDVVFTVVAPSATYAASATEHEHWAEMARRSGAPPRDARRQAFEQLPNLSWLEAEAAEQGLAVSEETVEREVIAQALGTFGGECRFEAFLQDTGQSRADFARRVRVHLLTEDLRATVTAGVAASITDAIVDAYIAEHGPERRDVRLVLTSRRRTGEAAKRELLGGGSWESVAARRSIDDETCEDGGEMRGVERGTLDPRLDRAVFRASPGQIDGPLRTRSGFWVFSVVRIEPAHVCPPAASRDIVRRRLVEQAEQERLEQFSRAFSEKWRQRTTCAPEYGDCSQIPNDRT